tara:strand:- start:1369 stop:1791 length:423 start_codon:yes stop_codon:yes gene_type:complete
MGNSNSIIKVNFEDIQSSIVNNNCILINVMKQNEQDCLIKSTININEEENIINEHINNYNKDINIIVYGKNSNDIKIYDKYTQLIQLGFTNVSIYIGGLFEWMLLQDIYGFENFPTTKSELDILKFKPNKLLFVKKIQNS